MDKIQNKDCIFMISVSIFYYNYKLYLYEQPFKYDPSHPKSEARPSQNSYVDRWDNNHVRMPCSPSHVTVS
jgi:hypothetical protein